MTCSLVVNSKSGNTRMVSGAIKRALQAAGVEFVHAAALSDDADADQVALEAQGACAADTVLVGFGATRARARLRSRRCSPPCTASASFCLVPAVLAPARSTLGRLSTAYRLTWPMMPSLRAGRCAGQDGPAVKQRYEAMLEQDPDTPALSCCSTTGSPQRITPPRKIWTTWLQPPKRPCWGSSSHR